MLARHGVGEIAMRWLLSWTIKLSLLALAYAVMTGNLSIQLPDQLLGYKVPTEAQAWVDRNAQIVDYGKRTEAAFKSIADSIK
jgi:hypothetical protein